MCVLKTEIIMTTNKSDKFKYKWNGNNRILFEFLVIK